MSVIQSVDNISTVTLRRNSTNKIKRIITSILSVVKLSWL